VIEPKLKDFVETAEARQQINQLKKPQGRIASLLTPQEEGMRSPQQKIASQGVGLLGKLRKFELLKDNSRNKYSQFKDAVRGEKITSTVPADTMDAGPYRQYVGNQLESLVDRKALKSFDPYGLPYRLADQF
jgi:hypothetical protein